MSVWEELKMAAALVVIDEEQAKWEFLITLVLDSLPAIGSRHKYSAALWEFWFWWRPQVPHPSFSKALVQSFRVALEARGLAGATINIRISALRKLANEAADNGLLAPELASGISRVKGVKRLGVRMGNWLSREAAQTLLDSPDPSTLKGQRDRAILAVLLGCALRRSELASLTVDHLQQRDGRWCVLDLKGKGGRVRTVPMPAWVKSAIDAWTSAAGITEGDPVPAD
jgi:site-specific recombinase XerC